MFNHKKLANPKQFQSLTGVSPVQFDSLYCATKKQYKTAEARRLFKKKRKKSHQSRTSIPSNTQGQITDVANVLQNVHKLQFIGDDLWTGQIKCIQVHQISGTRSETIHSNTTEKIC